MKKCKTRGVEIPISKINEGISLSIKNALKIQKNAEALLAKDKTGRYATVLFYYALEEFGKAIYLDRLKKESQKNNIHAFLYNHDLKIMEVENVYDDLNISKFEKIEHLKKPKPLSDKMILLRLTETANKGKVISNFKERSSLWLTDYDKNNGWKKPPRLDKQEIKKQLKKLRSTIIKWKKDYLTSNNFRHL